MHLNSSRAKKALLTLGIQHRECKVNQICLETDMIEVGKHFCYHQKFIPWGFTIKILLLYLNHRL